MVTGGKKPVAVCSDCIAYSYDEDDINQPCRKKYGERVCNGVCIDATDPVNWKECTACSGTGISFDGTECVACQESGWLLTRRR